MPDQGSGGASCERCGGSGAAARVARRQHYKSAVFGQRESATAPAPQPSSVPLVVTGTVLDISPHIVIIGHNESERRLLLGPQAKAWRGGFCEPGALPAGDRVIARLRPGHRDVADKLWAGIGRVTGTIVGTESGDLLVDEGVRKQRQIVMISHRAANSVAVRFPLLEPGNLIDVIGVRRGPVLEALVPATSQPSKLGASPGPAATAPGPASRRISGSAVWHEPALVGGDPDARGVGYPAIDPSEGCQRPPMADHGSFVMPYLSLGSLLHVRNECTRASRTLPVTGCAAIARLFHDRCLECGTSPRGRIADLTMASFVELGGELERGCFNATITME